MQTAEDMITQPEAQVLLSTEIQTSKVIARKNVLHQLLEIHWSWTLLIFLLRKVKKDIFKVSLLFPILVQCLGFIWLLIGKVQSGD